MVKTVATLALLLVTLPLNLALTAAALLRSLLIKPRRAVAADPKTDPDQRRQDDQGAGSSRASFHRGRASGDPRRVAQVPVHRPPVLPRGRPLLHRARARRAPGTSTALRRRSSGARRVDVYVPGLQPGRQPVRRARRGGARRLRGRARRPGDGRGDSTTSTRSPPPRPRSACPCPTPIASPTRSRSIDFDFGARPRPYILKSIAYDPVAPARPHAPAAGHARRDGRVRPRRCRSPRTTRGSCRSSSRARSTARTAPCATGACRLHCCCESSAFQLNYAMVDKPEIEAWVAAVRRRAAAHRPGVVRLHRGSDGRPLYAIECNPRTHSAITMFYDHPRPRPGLPRRPAPPRSDAAAASRPTYWLYHELWRLVTEPGTGVGAARGRSLRGKDAIFDWADPLPFLMVHHLQIPSLLLDEPAPAARAGLRIDFNIGKLVEPAGTDVTLRVLHLVGSAVSEFHADLSRLYARGCLDGHRRRCTTCTIAYVSPDGRWRFPADLERARARRGARAVAGRTRSTHLAALELDVMVPQMFCLPGMTHYRALFDVLGIPYVGNAPGRHGARRRQGQGQGGRRRRGRGRARRARSLRRGRAADRRAAGGGQAGGRRQLARGDAGARARRLRRGAARRPSRTPTRRSWRRTSSSAGRSAAASWCSDGDLVCLPLEEYAVDARPSRFVPRRQARSRRRRRPAPGGQGRHQGVDRRRRRPRHRRRVGRGAALPRRAGLPALQPVRLPRRSRRAAVVPRSGALLLASPSRV